MSARASLLLALFLCGLAAPARAVDVSQLSDFESDPCVQALAERNTAQHVDAPDSALSDACERAHGNAEVAWDFLTRTWLPRDVAASAASGSAPPLGVAGVVLAVAELLLAYAVLGAPIRAVALLSRPRAGPARALVAEAAGSLVVRLVLGGVLLALVALPVMRVVAAGLVLVAIAWRARGAPTPTVRAADDPGASRFAFVVASLLNDLAGALAGLVALALAARGHWGVLAVGVLLAVAFSLPAALRARRRLRRAPPALAAGAAVLALGVGALALADPVLARALAFAGAAPAYLIPLACAAFVLWRARLLDRPRPGARQVSGG